MKMDTSSKRFIEEKKTMEVMLHLYCREKHDGGEQLCDDCSELLRYSMQRLANCHFGEEKPNCSKCHTQCYKPKMKERVSAVMRYSGPRLIGHRPMLALKHVMNGFIHKPRKK